MHPNLFAAPRTKASGVALLRKLCAVAITSLSTLMALSLFRVFPGG